jgi:uncharacterized membrane protein YjdF
MTWAYINAMEKKSWLMMVVPLGMLVLVALLMHYLGVVPD